jgi:anti-anti-sigma factor
LETSSREAGGTAVYRIVGRIDLLTSPKLQSSISSVISGGSPRVILDMREVTFMTSAGLRFILTIAKQATAAKGGLAVFGVPPAVNEVFEIAGFQNIIPIVSDEAQARASLEREAP